LELKKVRRLKSSKSLKRAFLVSDIPFGYYQTSIEDAMKNCIRLIKETGIEAVKLEGGSEIAPIVEKLVLSGINVMAHIGLMPQMVNVMGGIKSRGEQIKINLSMTLWSLKKQELSL